MHISSSWNVDRVAACYLQKRPAARTVRPRYLYAQYRGDEVSVCGSRGKPLFTVRVDSKIVSARVCDGKLSVATEKGGQYAYDAKTGECLSQMRPIVGSDATAESSAAA